MSRAALVGAALVVAAATGALATATGMAGQGATASPAATSTYPSLAHRAGVGVSSNRVRVGPEPDGSIVDLDVSVFTPGAAGRAPAVVLAHGFGGSKADLSARATDLAAAGYVVLTYSARGFGVSGGRVHLDDPAFEIADARRLLDLLAKRPDVVLDGPGDPKVAILGGSYGGALALMTAGTDPRVDAVVPAITWHDLSTAFFPQSAAGPESVPTPAGYVAIDGPGPLKVLWASSFLTSGLASTSERGASVPTLSKAATAPLCGRFDPVLCRLFGTALETGTPSDELLTLLRAHSPAPSLGAVRAPTLLIQGMADSLFGLDQADATARALAKAGTPVAVRWIDGGHDGASSTAAADDAAAQAWIDHYLRGAGTAGELPVPGFIFADPIPRRSAAAPLRSLATYPGLGAEPSLTRAALPLKAVGPQTVLTPPGGQPASVTTIPGLGALGASLAPYQLAALRGQSAAFDSEPVTARTDIVGAPRVRLAVASTGAEVTLFVSLWQVNGGSATMPRRLVAPVQVPVVPGRPTTVEVVLPAATYTLEEGSTWRVLVTSTDSAYAGPRQARADRVTLASAVLDVPVGQGAALTTESERDGEALAVAASLLAVLLVLTALWWRRRRRRLHVAVRPDLNGVPIVVDRLVKTYADGLRAVDDVSWRAEQGQVVGLLGPNGAGKTTTMRMVLGLIRPDSGTVYVMGEPVSPGAPVLGRVGALVEGPGFLPHLTGRQNLEAFWAATGRNPDEARYEEVLDVAGLGDAVERPVRSYSHGMRQRLGIAQAMLGMPDLLVLDEPTNGLDPPQIAAMRTVLHAYAASGRTVVISSHLLAEVELTCSHVVVMHAGRGVMAGEVADLLDSADTTVIALAPGSDPEWVASALEGLDFVSAVEVDLDPAAPQVVVTATVPRPQVVRAVGAVGADIVGVTSRRHLEEVFLDVIAQAQGTR